MKNLKTAIFLIIMTALVILTSCGQPKNAAAGNIPSPVDDFNFLFKYGVTLRNKLDTFHGTFTKDMVLAPSITTHLELTQSELEQILLKMEEIDFFNYPDVFKIEIPPGGLISIVTPYSRYYFKVEHGSVVKELSWEDEILNEDEKADRLRELINLIRSIIESKEEYKRLPEPKGGYL